MAHRILIALTSHDRLGDTGKKTGAYLAEITHPYYRFVEAGHEVDFVSVKGGEVPLDGVDRADAANARFLDDAALMQRVRTTPAADAIDPARYDAILFAGGHGTVWDFPHSKELARIAAAIYERGGVVAAVCHGPSALVNVYLSSGEPLVRGKEVAAFTNDEERAVGLERVVPFLLADALVERGAIHRPAPDWASQVVVSERLVTGQNPASAAGVADATNQLLAH